MRFQGSLFSIIYLIIESFYRQYGRLIALPYCVIRSRRIELEFGENISNYIGKRPIHKMPLDKY